MFRKIAYNNLIKFIIIIALSSCQQKQDEISVQKLCNRSEKIRCDSIDQSLIDSLKYCFYVYNSTSVLTSNLRYPNLSNIERDVFIPVEEDVVFEGYSVFGDSAINYYFSFRYNDTIRLENNCSYSNIGTIRTKPKESIIYFWYDFLDSNWILSDFEYSSERCRREWIRMSDIFSQKRAKFKYKCNPWLEEYLSK